MARRVFLHVGPPKTGTSFLQAMWFRARSQLAEQGVLYPGERAHDQFLASAVVLQKDKTTSRMSPRALRQWDSLTEAVGAWPGDAILSSEHYSMANVPRARAVLSRLSEVGDETHVVVTARDLSRQVPAAWRQSIKQGNDQTFDEYVAELAARPRRGFWWAQDLPRMLERLAPGVPAERVHVIIHPRAGSSSRVLWERMCAVTGVNPDPLGRISRVNESLGVVHTEVMRRINQGLPADRDRVEMGRLTRSLVANQIFADLGSPVRMAVPEGVHAWLSERSRVMVDELRPCRYDIVGELEDLLVPAHGPRGQSPDSVTEAQVAELATLAFRQDDGARGGLTAERAAPRAGEPATAGAAAGRTCDVGKPVTEASGEASSREHASQALGVRPDRVGKTGAAGIPGATGVVATDMRIEIWSDVVCPWCYIGKRRLEAALAAFDHADDVEVAWRSYQLDPGAPRVATETTAESLARKYGQTVEGARRMMDQVEAVAAEEGLLFRLSETRRVSTVDAHRLLHLALHDGGTQVQGRVKESLLAAHFVDALDVGDHATLRKAAVDAGLDEARVEEVLASEEYAAEVWADIERAQRYGATGVPFFVVDEKYGVSGAQPVEVFAQLLERAWADTHPALTMVDPGVDRGADACGPDGCTV